MAHNWSLGHLVYINWASGSTKVSLSRTRKIVLPLLTNGQQSESPRSSVIDEFLRQWHNSNKSNVEILQFVHILDP